MSRKRKQKTKQEPKMDKDLAYEICDDLDLPDGAFWAMIEDMSGATPDEFTED